MNGTSAPTTGQRLGELDALRGLAAVAVMIFHYTHRYQVLYGHRDQLWFTVHHHTFGIPMFFMLSGYVIYMILEKTERPLDFVVSRFSRLYPAYWTCLLITFCGVRLFGLDGRESTVRDLLWNTVMFQEFFNAKFVDGAYWTLSVELSFYASMFLLLVTRQLRRVELLIVSWLGLTVWDLFFRRDMGIRLDDRLEIFLLLDYAQYFCAGILLFRLRHSGVTPFRLLLLAACFGIALLGRRYPNDLIALFGMGLFLVGVFQKLPLLAVKPLLFIGAISYPLYLLHQNLGFISIRELTALGLNSNLAIFATMAIIGVLATVVTYGVEKPALRLLRARYREWKQRGTSGVEPAASTA